MEQPLASRTARNDRSPAYAGAALTDANLILEGGAMRGQFTAGVLDFLMDNGIWCKNVYGTSAGALNGYSYIAGEIGRTCYLNTKYCGDSRYLSMRNFALTGSAIRKDFMFDAIPNTLEPFDFEAFRDSPMRLTTVASNLETGEADYHIMKEAQSERELSYLQASASMPLVSKIIEVDGKKLLDGGPCDSVPLLHAILSGTSDKHIVVLTQDASYVKSPNKTMPLVRRVYADYPLFIERMEHRHFEYNRTYRWIRRLHDAGEVYMIQPSTPVTISNMEKDPEKLFALYEQGYEEAAKRRDELIAYLEK
ncbi:MAG: patatin family protein [Slackia sp.]|nr:patatin family protein [Slackia sp.]